jgi:hypothetical protein
MTRFAYAFAGLVAASSFALVASAQDIVIGDVEEEEETAEQLEPVDVELVLAVDVSWSMDYDEQVIQREGYVTAFRDEDLINAMTGGFRGKVAVTYFEWASEYAYRQTVPWTIIDSPEAAHAFADAIAAADIGSARGTSISNALFQSANLINSNQYEGIKRVIDVSGDGQNISGAAVEPVRDAVVQQGIIINGLPLMMRPFETGDLAAYYKDHVIGGSGAFVIPVEDVNILASSIRQKLILEIAGGFPEETRADLGNVIWGEETP